LQELNAVDNFAAKTSECLLGPGLSPQELESIGLPIRDGNIPFGRDPVPNLLKIMELQRTMRSTPVRGKDGPIIGGVGGHAVLTTVTENQIVQRVIHKWPDAVAPEAPGVRWGVTNG
jgi:hypothetical protein